jgi:DNA-binding NtrC family response regulator
MTQAVLLVDENLDLLRSLSRALENQPYQLYTARRKDEAISVMKVRPVDVIVAGEQLAGASGVDLLAWAASQYPDAVGILMVGDGATETLVRAVNQARVYYFVEQPVSEPRLAIEIRKALEHRELLARQERLLKSNQQQALAQRQCADEMELLVQVMSRDLKRPLSSAAQSCQSLLERHSDALDREIISLIEDALEAVGTMQDILKGLLGNLPSADHRAAVAACEIGT